MPVLADVVGVLLRGNETMPAREFVEALRRSHSETGIKLTRRPARTRASSAACAARWRQAVRRTR